MRIAVCAAYEVGYELTKFILGYPDNGVVFFATCDKDASRYNADITHAVWDEDDWPIYQNVDVNSQEFISLLRDKEIDLVLLLWWPIIVKQEAIEAAKTGWINLHPSLLPYCQGKHPWYWNIADNVPFGVTIHFIQPEIDKGDILFQRIIPVNITDTGETVYAKSIEAIISLFKDSYSSIVAGRFTQMKQGAGTFHWGYELDKHSCIDLDSTYTARDLLNRIRARTFKNGKAAFFYENGKRYEVRVEIKEAE